MAEKYYVVEGAKLQCDKGGALGKLKVISQQKAFINNKLKATDKDKLLEPPFFGMCSCTNKTCSPALQEWQYASRKSGIGNKKLLFDNSQITCATGGIVKIKDANQKIMCVGAEEHELDKKYPKLLGEIIFVNGFLSDPIVNSEQTLNNAIRDVYPDNPNDKNYKQGESVNEENRADESDIFDNSELEEQLPEKGRTDKVIEKALKANRFKTPLSFNNDVEKFWGYWNSKANKYKASDVYGTLFNAYRNDHYINGSHGLGSNAAHRIDHGISLGYIWAKKNWFLLSPEETDIPKDAKNRYILSFTPQYSPITVVAHSHGAAMGAGVAIGIMHYAAEQKWKKIALNIIFLGVHQPQNLAGTLYDNFIEDKVDYYEVNIDFPQFFADKEKAGKSFLNDLADLFDREHDKLQHYRGIHEHLSKILDNTTEFKGRAVQFTFANDRADAVTRDGDIPDILNACNPSSDFSLICPEYVNSKRGWKSRSFDEKANKKPIAAKKEGMLYLPKHIANRRFDFSDIPKKASKTQKEYGDEWGNYEGVALDWADAFEEYKLLKELYETIYNTSYYYRGYVTDRIIRGNEWLYEHNPFGDGYTDKQKKQKELYNKVTKAYENMLRNYAALQQANLYAHFSPVSLLTHKKVLSDFPSDSYGKTNIFERIKKAGEGKFYRVNYETDDGKEMTEEEKREFAEKYVEGDGQKLLISTSIANTSYINNVIKAYIGDEDEIKRKADEQLYKEPNKD